MALWNSLIYKRPANETMTQQDFAEGPVDDPRFFSFDFFLVGIFWSKRFMYIYIFQLLLGISTCHKARVVIYLYLYISSSGYLWQKQITRFDGQ